MLVTRAHASTYRAPELDALVGEKCMRISLTAAGKALDRVDAMAYSDVWGVEMRPAPLARDDQYTRWVDVHN